MSGQALVIFKRGWMYPHLSVCAGGCRHIGTGGKPLGTRVATRVASIGGYPAAGLCDSCAKDWRRMWDGALDGEIQEPELAVAA